MSKLNAGLGGNAGAVTAGVVVVGVLALGTWIGNKRNAPDVVPAALVETQPKGGDTTASTDALEPKIEVAEPAVEVQPETTPDVAEVLPVPAPAFDEVRREPDGMTVVAGRAVPGATVKLMQDGVEIASAKADASGRFATLAMIAPDGAAHVLSLLQNLDGVDVPSEDEIFLTPINPPIVVAEADIAEPEVEAQVEKPVTAQAEEAPDAGVVTDAADAAEAEPENAEEQIEVAEAEVTTPTTEVATETEATPQAATDTPEATQVADDEVNDTPEAPTEVVIANATFGPEVTEAPAASDITPETETAATEQDAAVKETTPELQTAEIAEESQAERPVVSPAPAEPVTATPEVALLKSTAEGVELLNADAPEVMDNVAIDTISYSDLGEVQLAGRAQTDAETVRIYLDNAAVISLPVDDQGRWRGDVPDVDQGIYTLRVDEVGEDGTVTSRIETPFKREAPEVLAQAAAQDGPIKAITVQSGATLWAIARDRYGDGKLYVRVFEANADSIRDPDLIYPGQIFDLPE